MIPLPRRRVKAEGVLVTPTLSIGTLLYFFDSCRVLLVGVGETKIPSLLEDMATGSGFRVGG